MRIRKIIEEFQDMVKTDNRYGSLTLSIYKNPTQKEFKEIIEEQGGRPELRFIIDIKGKTVYFFSSNLLHHQAARKLNIKYSFRDRVTDKYIFGFGDYSKSKGKVETPYWKEIKDQKWLKKYFGA